MANPYMTALLGMLRQKEAQKRKTEQALTFGQPSKLAFGLNVLTDVLQKTQQQKERDRLLEAYKASEANKQAIEQRNRAFQGALGMYRAGLPIPGELATQAGMPQLAGKQAAPKATGKYFRNRLTGKIYKVDGDAMREVGDMGADPYASQFVERMSPIARSQLQLMKPSLIVKKPTDQINMTTGKPVLVDDVNYKAVDNYLKQPGLHPQVRQVLLAMKAGATQEATMGQIANGWKSILTPQIQHDEGEEWETWSVNE